MAARLKDWNRAGHLLETLPNRFEKRVDKILMRNAEIYRDEIVMLIEMGDPSWVPKTDQQADRSGSERLFIGATGTFLSNIENRGIMRVKAARGIKRIFVGARPDIKHGPSNMSMERIANILQNTPSEDDRDLFGPAWERAQYRIRNNLSKLKIGMELKD